jgi:DNA-binding NarL/FixJ family response regulator
MLSKRINLAIVHDHVLFRKALRNYLSEQKDLHVSIHASDMVELLNKLKDVSVDVLLIDIMLPDVNCKEVLNTIMHEYPEIKVLVLSMSTDMDVISDLLDFGIYGYLSKADEPEDLLQAIAAASENRIYRNRQFTEALYWKKQNNNRSYAGKAIVSLDDREKKILKLIWEEKSNKEIAGELFLGIRSIEKIRQDIKEKIGAKSIVGILKYAINEHLIRV